MTKFLVAVALLAILIVGGGVWFASVADYSEGYRVGKVIKLSHKGYVFKTWEGTLDFGYLQTDPQGGVATRIWDFSVAPGDVQVRKDIDAAIAAARRAIAIAPSLADAHSTLGFTLFQGRLDARAAREPFERSRELGAGDGEEARGAAAGDGAQRPSPHPGSARGPRPRAMLPAAARGPRPRTARTNPPARPGRGSMPGYRGGGT